MECDVTLRNMMLSFSDYSALLQNHVFLHRELSRGLSFPDQSIDYLYCSHFLEHLFDGPPSI
jgi:hypothetical protein